MSTEPDPRRWWALATNASLPTNASLRLIEQRPKRVPPIDYAPAADPHDGPGERLTEPIWLEPFPNAELALESDLLGSDALYEQRESPELVHGGPTAPPGAATGRPDPARCARLLRPRERRGARDDPRLGRQRAPARPPGIRAERRGAAGAAVTHGQTKPHVAEEGGERCLITRSQHVKNGLPHARSCSPAKRSTPGSVTSSRSNVASCPGCRWRRSTASTPTRARRH